MQQQKDAREHTADRVGQLQQRKIGRDRHPNCNRTMLGEVRGQRCAHRDTEYAYPFAQSAADIDRFARAREESLRRQRGDAIVHSIA